MNAEVLSPAASASAEPVSVPESPRPLGAFPDRGRVCYRVWAPDHGRVAVRVVEGNAGPHEVELEREEDGHFVGADPRGRPGDLYRFVLGEDGAALPDPASRFQPFGVEGPSQVVDPSAYVWRSVEWRRPPARGRVIYELHVGTFTREGTFAAAARRLDALADLGVNTLELMPLADFAGDRNWGYDGVMPFAPARCYGSPDDLRALIDAAHERGLAVVLDVVYNHLGPCGAVHARYARGYFHQERHTVWGQNFDYACPAVRAHFLENARMWLDEYRFDGLRLDATHAIEDDSPTHLVAEIAALARARGAFVIAEDDRNEARVIRPVDQGGWGLDAVWADDFHHTVRVALTRQREAHFASFTGEVAECVRTLERGWLYEGQHAPHRGAPRGTSAEGRPPECFVHCISNHDQAGNRPLGERLHDSVSPEAYRALAMLLCLTPYTPMLFMGQEWAAGAPFLFFTDHPSGVGEGIAEGRRREFAHYGANYDAATLARMPDPQAEETFRVCQLDWDERARPPHAEVLALHRTCLRLRASTPVFQNPPRDRWTVEQAGENAFALRWRAADGDWLLLVGLAPGRSTVAVRGLSSPSKGRAWRVIFSSNDAAFGGDGPGGPARITADHIVFVTPGALLLREV
jgi:maltooligosyltrehalose trehalohydrolase